jgi:glycosyltransferase involved in cell wall biosynthesis
VSILVSVVMATYNSGEELERTIASLDEQSMPAEQFEVVVVDDGSTDGTFQRLQAMAVQRPNLRVSRIPNSGWPGRPRNLGTAAAHGEYVLYLDHDDYLFPEALQRMYAYARDNDADVLLGKETKLGAQSVGWRTWRCNVPVAAVDARSVQLMTPHKLYRRDFLRRHDIRFPEGRVRLEDYHFNGQVYARSPRIAILADYPCYRWMVHGGNAHLARTDLDQYWRSFDESLVAILAPGVDPEVRDVLLRRWYGRVILDRLPAAPAHMRARIHADADRLLAYFPARLDAGLSHRHRLYSALFRARDVEGIARLADSERELHVAAAVDMVRWEGRTLMVQAHGSLRLGEGESFPLRLVDKIPTRVLPAGVEVDGAVLDLADDARSAHVELSVRGRRSGVEWPVPGEGRVVCTDGVDVTVGGEVSAGTGAYGAPLPDDLWDIRVRVDAFGYHRQLRAPAPDGQDRPLPGKRLGVVKATAENTLALDLRRRALRRQSAPEPG